MLHQLLVNCLREKRAINICDKKQCIYSLDGKKSKSPMYANQVIDNDIMNKNGINENIYIKKRSFSKIYDRKTYGMTFKGITVPIVDEKKEVVGWFGISVDMDEDENIVDSYRRIKEFT